MRSLWWVLFVIIALPSIYRLATSLRRARRGEATPTHAAGSIPADLALLLIVGSYLVGSDSRLAMAMILASLPLIVGAVILYVRAVRRARRTVR